MKVIYFGKPIHFSMFHLVTPYSNSLRKYLKSSLQVNRLLFFHICIATNVSWETIISLHSPWMFFGICAKLGLSLEMEECFSKFFLCHKFILLYIDQDWKVIWCRNPWRDSYWVPTLTCLRLEEIDLNFQLRRKITLHC